jgi:ribosomal protein L11 methyltransferase
VLDYGTGSGLLGLAALLYGASEAAGTDIDRDALANCQSNCLLNGLHMDLYTVSEEDCDSAEEQSVAMQSSRGSGTDFRTVAALDGKQFDLTVANILAPILMSLAPELAARTKAGGRICLSGLVTLQADRVSEVYSEFFDDMKVEDTEEDWVVLTGRRKAL